MSINLETLVPFDRIKESPVDILNLVDEHGQVVLLRNNTPVYIVMKAENAAEFMKPDERHQYKKAGYTLQDAMQLVLRETEGNQMHAADLADAIYQKGLYFKKDGSKAGYNQIRARCGHYPNMFEALPKNTIKLKPLVAEIRIDPKTSDLGSENERTAFNMAKGDRYIYLTNFLRMQHSKGIDEFSLSFTEIDTISKNPFPPSTRKYSWGNTAGHSYSISWLKAGYVARADLDAKRTYFSYDLDRANDLLSR